MLCKKLVQFGKGLGKVEAKGKRKGKCFWSGSGASGAMRLGHNG